MEKCLQKQCVDYCKSLGLTVHANNPPAFKRTTYGTLSGLPDLKIVNFNAYVELKDKEYTKAHKDRQEKQKQRRKEFTKAGAKCYKVDEFEKFIKIIEFLKRYTTIRHPPLILLNEFN